MSGGRAACGPAQRFQPSVEMLDQAYAAAPLAGLVVASPANPTGTMIAPDHLAELARWCRDHEVRLVSDEIYHGVTDHTVAASCAWEHDREAIVISSFSKYWGMTGWRLGWSLVPTDLTAVFRRHGRQLRPVPSGAGPACGDRRLH